MKEFFIVKFQFETKMQCDNKLLFDMPTKKIGMGPVGWTNGCVGECFSMCAFECDVSAVCVCAAP